MSPINDAQRIRVIRALLGMGSAEFANVLGISVGALTNWEKGRCEPQSDNRKRISEICHEHKISFLPSGMPVPYPDAFLFKEKTNA